MAKKAISAILASLMLLSLAGCTNEDNKESGAKGTPTSEASIEDEGIPLSGYWTKDFTKNELVEENVNLLDRVETLTNNYELEYLREEKVKSDSNEGTINENYIYLENNDAEPNRIINMWAGTYIFGSEMNEGQVALKITFNLDKEIIKEVGSFDFASTSIGTYSEAVLNNHDRDYTELNKKIFDIIAGNSKEDKIENNVDGLLETIRIKDNSIFYTLESKRYTFVK